MVCPFLGSKSCACEGDCPRDKPQKQMLCHSQNHFSSKDEDLFKAVILCPLPCSLRVSYFLGVTLSFSCE